MEFSVHQVERYPFYECSSLFLTNYEIIDLGLPLKTLDHAVNSIRPQMRDNKTTEINFEGSEGDGQASRIQSYADLKKDFDVDYDFEGGMKLSKLLVERVIQRSEKLIIGASKNDTVQGIFGSYIDCEGGCTQQSLHCDYSRDHLHKESLCADPPFQLFSQNSNGTYDHPPPLGMIVSLEPGSKFVVTEDTCNIYLKQLNGAHINPNDFKEKTIELGVGKALLFHGLLYHAGAGYNTPNLRFHSYIVPVKSTKGKTISMFNSLRVLSDEDKFLVASCRFRNDGAAALVTQDDDGNYIDIEPGNKYTDEYVKNIFANNRENGSSLETDKVEGALYESSL